MTLDLRSRFCTQTFLPISGMGFVRQLCSGWLQFNPLLSSVSFLSRLKLLGTPSGNPSVKVAQKHLMVRMLGHMVSDRTLTARTSYRTIFPSSFTSRTRTNPSPGPLHPENVTKRSDRDLMTLLIASQIPTQRLREKREYISTRDSGEPSGIESCI